VQVDAQYRSKHYFSLTQAEASTENGYSVANARVSYRTADDRIEVAAHVSNFTDEEYLVQTFDLSGPDYFGMTEQYYGRPRWWGVSLRYNFGS
jgi:iron complex outermembrane receptor protein